MRATVLSGILLMVSPTYASGVVPFVAVPQVSVAPTVDGRMAEGEWDAAATTCGFGDIQAGHPARGSVVVSACYDARALYVLFRCSGEPLDQLKGGASERDSSIWGGSLVEVFLAPAHWPADQYAHLGLNHAATMADELCGGGGKALSWNPDWEGATGTQGDAWIAEMAIPWAVVEVGEPRAGSALRANFARNAAAIGEISSWAPVKGGFHQPERFGSVRLAGRGPVVRLEALPGRQSGPTTIEAALADHAPGASLAVSLIAKSGRHSVRSRFAGPEARASATVEVPGGASAVEVTARDAAGNLLWQQRILLDLPDLAGRIEDLRERIAALATGLARDAETLGAELNALEAESSGALNAEELAALMERIDVLQGRVTDVDMLARVNLKRLLPKEPARTPPYYVTSPVATRKIQPHASDPGPLADVLRVSMARGEYEPVQIVVCAVREDLARVRVSASRLRGDGGRVIPARRVVVNPVGMVRCKLVTGGATLKGEVPDVLLPNRPMNVSAGRRQPFFVTVQTTADDASGEYRGAVKVRVDNAPSFRLPIVVGVHDATLPVKSHLRTAFVLWGNFRRFMESTDHDDYMDAYISYSKVMLAHRLSPITMWRVGKTAHGEWDFSDFDRYLSELAPLGLTTFNFGGNGWMAATRNADLAKVGAHHFKDRGWWDLHYVYGHDEASHDLAQLLRDKYGPLIEAAPDLKIMQTGWSPHAGLKGHVRIWCPLTQGAHMPSIRAAQREGEEVWWYVCCGPRAPYANLFVDYPGIDHRILGWQTFQHGIQGFLYWGVDVWKPFSLPLDEYGRPDYATWNPNSYSTINGDGYLLYPGTGNTAVPSVRLALLRDGFEDYDLFTEAAELAARSGREGRRLRELLRFEDIIPTLTEYAQEGATLLERREAILREMDRVARAAGGTRAH